MINRYLIASIICLISFCVLALLVSSKSVFDNDLVTQGDYNIFLTIVNSHFNAINQFMVYLTIYGREAFWILIIILLLLLGKKKGKRIAVLMILVIIVIIPIGIVAKQIIERPRPTIPESDFLITADSEFAFPSGHALVVSAGAAICITLFRSSYKELIVSILLTAEAGLVCFSRIYVGGHYPLDVVAGILLGTAISLLFVWKQNKLEILYNRLSKMTCELRH